MTTRARPDGDANIHDTLPRDELATPADRAGGAGGEGGLRSVRITRPSFSISSAVHAAAQKEGNQARHDRLFSSTGMGSSRDAGRPEITSPIASKLDVGLEAPKTAVDTADAATTATGPENLSAAKFDADVPNADDNSREA